MPKIMGEKSRDIVPLVNVINIFVLQRKAIRHEQPDEPNWQAVRLLR
jgi:hypothetical protein